VLGFELLFECLREEANNINERRQRAIVMLVASGTTRAVVARVIPSQCF
jgi:hypothetical protein